MSSGVRFWLVAAAAAAMLSAAGCGGGGGGNDDDDGAVPTRTATPAAGATTRPADVPTATPTPGAAASTVTFTLSSTAALQSTDVRVAYPTAKGGFRGSADQAACTSSAAGAQFVTNDQDNGTLILVIASPTDLTFPITITCTFDATQTLVANDLTTTVNEVVSGGAPGNAADAQVAVGVS